jgi:glycolate oxidase iron-sulfur subunit
MTELTHSAFDPHRPPAQELLDDCVHCGFCLPTCPTYQLWGEEMDSPRGRIYLMNLAANGEIGLDGALHEHIDACLGCMACVTSCPSGVQYDRLLESVRPQLERNVPRGRADRLFRDAIFALFPYRGRLRAAAIPGALYQRLRAVPAVKRLASRLSGRLATGPIARLAAGPIARLAAGPIARLAAGPIARLAAGPIARLAAGPIARLAAGPIARLAAGPIARLAAVESLLPPVRLRDAFARLPERVVASGAPRRRVAMLTGCVQDVFFHPVNAATARVLAAEGCDVLIPRDQGCCGALELHAGRERSALVRARRTIATFERLDVDAVVANVAGCGSSMKEYGTLLSDDPEWAQRAAAFSAAVRDVSEVLAELKPRAPRHPIRARVAYHDACHLGHAQGVRAQPRAVLRTIPRLELLDVPEAELCCGSAGIYNLVQPEAAAELGARKAANIASTRPDIVVTANPGCLLQIRRHLNPGDGTLAPPLLHPVQLLDASIRGVAPASGQAL